MFHQSKVVIAKVLTVMMFCGIFVMPNGSIARADTATFHPTVPTTKADLTIQNAKISPAEAQKGEKINIYFELKNTGNRNAENFYVKVSDGQGWGSETLERRLIPRQKKIFNLFFEVTEFQAAGEHKFTIFADSRENIMESNENNNSAQVKVNVIVIVTKGTIAILMPNLPAPRQIITPSTADAVTFLASRFKVKAATEDFLVKALTLNLADSNATEAINKIMIKFPTNLSTPNNLDGQAVAYGSSGADAYTFYNLNFPVLKNRDDVNFEVYVTINTLGQGTKGGEQIRIDFVGYPFYFSAFGMDSNQEIREDAVQNVEGSTQIVSCL